MSEDRKFVLAHDLTTSPEATMRMPTSNFSQGPHTVQPSSHPPFCKVLVQLLQSKGYSACWVPAKLQSSSLPTRQVLRVGWD